MSIYNIGGDAINAAYNIGGSALGEAYDIDGNVVSSGSPTSFLDSSAVTEVYTSTITSQPQGGCIDDSSNVYVCFYSAGKFLKHNLATGTDMEATFAANAYGHANGMAYNPNTGYLYLAGMKATGEVYVFDTSFNLVHTLYAKDENGIAFNCWNLAYDRKHQRFVAMSSGKLYCLDDYFEYISNAEYNPDEIWPYTAQDIETDGEYIYCLNYSPNTIAVVDFNGNLVKMIDNSAFSGEPESMCYDWINDVYYLEGKSTYYVIRRVVFKG